MFFAPDHLNAMQYIPPPLESPELCAREMLFHAVMKGYCEVRLTYASMEEVACHNPA